MKDAITDGSPQDRIDRLEPPVDLGVRSGLMSAACADRVHAA